jgi:hypothetical protein
LRERTGLSGGHGFDLVKRERTVLSVVTGGHGFSRAEKRLFFVIPSRSQPSLRGKSGEESALIK